MTTSLIFQAYFIVLVSSFAISASRERISAFVDLSNSSLFRIERIRKLSLQITEAKNYAFDIVVLERNTRKDKKSDVIRPEEVIVSPNPKDGTYEFTVSSEDEIVKWISKNTPQMVLCFAQDIRMPYAIINARRKEFLSPKVKIISVLEDVSNSYQSYKNGVETLEKIAEVLMFSDYTIFTNARDQKFLKEQFQNGKFDIPSRSLLKKLESGIVLHHVSSIKDLIMASRPRDAVSLDRVWAKTKRIRRDVQESNASNSGSNVSSTSPSPTKSSNSSFVAISPTTSTNITLTPSSKTSSNSTVEAESPTTSTNINLTLSTTVSSNSTVVLAASPTPTNMTYTPSTTTSSNFTIVAVYPTPSINMSTSPSTTSSNSTVETASPTPTNMTMSSSTTPLNSTAVAVFSTPSTNMTFTSPFPTSSNSTVIAASPASSNMTFITPSPTSSKSIVVAASPTTSSNMTYTTPSPTSSKSIVVAASPTSSSNMTTSPSTTSSNSTVVAASPSTSTNMTMSPPTKSSNSTVLAASPSTSTNMTMSPPTKSSNSTIVAASPTTSTNMSYTTPSTTTSSNSTVVAASPTASANMTTSPSTTSSNSTVLAASPVITSSATSTTISPNITVVATSQTIITSLFSIDNQSVSIYPTSSVTYFPPTSATPLMTTTVSFISNKSISIEQPSNTTSSALSSTTMSMKTTVSFSSKSTVPPSPNATSFPQISSTPVSTTVSYIGKQSSSVELKPNATVTESSSAMSPVLQQSSETPTRQTQLVTTLAPMFSTSIRMSTTALPLVPSAVISSSILSTTIQVMTPTPSSVQSVITTPSMTIAPPTKDDEKYIITLEGNCHEILDNTDSLKKFQEEFKKVIASVAMILENEVEILYTKCGSINVTFIVRNAKVRNTTALLKKAASEGKIQIVVDGKNYTSSGLVVIPLTEPTVKPSSKIIPTTEPDNKLALYLYITFGAVMGLVFLIGLIVLVVRCKKDKTSGSFSLGSDTDVELKRFGGIPRASYYRVEMYGEPVEVDAARSGVSNDEYEGDIVPYGQTTFSSNSTARSTNVNANKDEFTMGNLPEWNVPKLKSSDMVVNSPSKKSKGAGQNENDKVNDDDVDNDTGLHAYDNPVMTFGDPNANSFD